MKWKYYLRGLGVGIIVTALVIGITNGGQKESLSDAEIRQRAEQLGMVDRGSMVLADLAGNNTQEQTSGDVEDNSSEQETESTEENSSEQETESTEENSSEQETESTESSSLEQEAESTEDTSSQETEESQSAIEEPIEDMQETVSGSQSTASNVVVNTDSATITIEWGKTSLAVSRLLEQAGLIEDAVAFDLYLCSQGYSKNIRTGTYVIPFGTSKEEIARMISNVQ